MILEFKDGTQIEVNNIFGGPQLIFGSMRDCLTIEFDPDKYKFEELKQYFTDRSNTIIMYTYENNERIQVGEGYIKLVSISYEIRVVNNTVIGPFSPPVTEEFYSVKIAQLNYAEYQLGSTIPK
jgi:hypothetical protein